MLEKGRISPLELFVLVTFFTIGTTILAIPAMMTAKTKQDAWLSSLLGIFLCVLLAYFYVICSKSMRKETYIYYLERVYGKVLGKIIGFTYVYLGFVGTSTLLFQFGNFITTQMLVETPIEIVILMLGLLIIIVTRAGLEVLARTGELLILWFVILFIALVILLLPEIELQRLSPLNEAKIPSYISATLTFVATAGFPLVVFLIFYPGNVNTPEKTKWSFMLGVFFGTLVVGIIVLLCVLVLGSAATARQIYPSYVLAKTVSVFDIIERIESVMAGMWVLSIFFKSPLYFYTSVIGLADLLAVKNYRFLVIPMGILTMLFSTVVYPDVPYMNTWDDKYWEPYAIIMGLLIPLMTLITDKIKNRLQKNNDRNNKSSSI